MSHEVPLSSISLLTTSSFHPSLSFSSLPKLHLASKANYAKNQPINLASSHPKQPLSPTTLSKFARMSLNAARVSTANLRKEKSTATTNEEVSAIISAMQTLVKQSWAREAERQREIREEIDMNSKDDKNYLKHLKLQHQIERKQEETVGKRLDQRIREIDDKIDIGAYLDFAKLG